MRNLAPYLPDQMMSSHHTFPIGNVCMRKHLVNSLHNRSPGERNVYASALHLFTQTRVISCYIE